MREILPNDSSMLHGTPTIIKGGLHLSPVGKEILILYTNRALPEAPEPASIQCLLSALSVVSRLHLTSGRVFCRGKVVALQQHRMLLVGAIRDLS